VPREKSAGVIIYTKEFSKIFYLLLHYTPAEVGKHGHWGFAKGHVEEDETEEETARREVAEETGIKDIKIIPGFREQEKYFFRKVYGLKGEARKKAPWVFKLVIFFIGEVKNKEVKISDEHIGFVWLPYDEALKKISFKNSKKLLKDANDFVTKTEKK